MKGFLFGCVARRQRSQYDTSHVTQVFTASRGGSILLTELAADASVHLGDDRRAVVSVGMVGVVGVVNVV